MKIEPNSIDSFLATSYLLGATVAAYIGWGVIKLFKFITPQASKVVAKLVTDWIIDLLKPAIDSAIDSKLEKHLSDLSKIKEATHDSREKSEVVLTRLLEIADKIEQKMEKQKDE